jgi:hypothetical protein
MPYHQAAGLLIEKCMHVISFLVLKQLGGLELG